MNSWVTSKTSLPSGRNAQSGKASASAPRCHCSWACSCAPRLCSPPGARRDTPDVARARRALEPVLQDHGTGWSGPPATADGKWHSNRMPSPATTFAASSASREMATAANAEYGLQVAVRQPAARPEGRQPTSASLESGIETSRRRQRSFASLAQESSKRATS